MATPQSARRTVSVPTRRPRNATPIRDIDKEFLLFATHRRAAKVAGTARDKARDFIKAWFDNGGDADHEITFNENGSKIVEFDEPVVIDGQRVVGIENRRTDRSELDLDKVDEWLDSLPEAQRRELTRKLYREVRDTVFQPDELFKLQQEGILSEKQMDGLYSTATTWALCVTEG